MIPDELHLLPVLDDAVLHGVGELKEASVLLCFLANENLLVMLMGEDLLVLRPPDAD